MLNKKQDYPQDVDYHPAPEPAYPFPISPANTEKLFDGCEDFESRRVHAGGTNVAVFACWLDGVVSGSDTADQILRPLTDPARFAGAGTAEAVIEILAAGGVNGF